LWVSSLHWSLLIIAACLSVQFLETYALGLPRDRRLVRDAPEFAVRVVGLSHFVVALFFLLTGSRARGRAARVRLGALALIGAGVCVAFGWLGGTANPICLAGFYVIFMAHAFRDESFFHRQQLGSVAPPQSDASPVWLQAMAVGVLGAIVVPVYVYVAFARGDPAGSPWLALFPPQAGKREAAMIRALLPPSWSLAEIFGVFGLPFALVAAGAAIPIATAGRAARAHAPLLKVLALSVALVVSSAIVGSAALHLVILMHFVGWFLFTTARLRHAERAQPANTVASAWLRGTVHGFWVLHGGAAAVFLTIIVTNHYLVAAAQAGAYGWPGPNPVALLFGASAFYYWTIAHVALSVPLPVARASSRD
jgi:hypothetical protein